MKLKFNFHASKVVICRVSIYLPIFNLMTARQINSSTIYSPPVYVTSLPKSQRSWDNNNLAWKLYIILWFKTKVWLRAAREGPQLATSELFYRLFCWLGILHLLFSHQILAGSSQVFLGWNWMAMLSFVSYTFFWET